MTLPTPLERTQPAPPSVMARLADIPEEEIWLAKQKSARTRRAYRLDVRHFMATLGITSSDELRQVDHRAVIAWERAMREVEHAAPSTIRRRLSALAFSKADARKLLDLPKIETEDGELIIEGQSLARAQWGSHDHPTLMSPDRAEPGNGLLLFFRVDDFDTALLRARKLVARLEEEPDVNPATGTLEFALRDPDEYYVMISALDAA